MKAVVLEEKNKLSYKTISAFSDEKGKVLVDIKATALNHRDVWIMKGMYPGIKYPIILGSDGAGIYNNKSVIFNPSINWGVNEAFQSKDFNIIGLPNNGTFAEQILLDETQLFPMPAHLDFITAAALPLAGLTAFRVLFSRCKLKKNERVLISGIGGGVALLAFQFSVAIGAEVYVTSSDDSKIDKAIQMGAKGGANYKEKDWQKKLQKEVGGFDVIIDSAGGNGFENLLKITNFGARVGIYGGTRGAVPNLSPQLIFWKQLSILGSTMGSDDDFENMLIFVNQNNIIPIVDKVFSFAECKEAFDYMDSGKQIGKIVLIPNKV